MNMEPIKMTQEEKLEKAKELYKTANADQRYVLECLFSELRESENEKMRKAIKKHFEMDSHLSYSDIDKKDILAWLEKQGSQKLANSAKTCKDEQNHTWSEEDELTRKALINLVEMYYGGCVDKSEKNRLLDWLKSLKERIKGE